MALKHLSFTGLAYLQVVKFIDELFIAIVQQSLHLVSRHRRDLRSRWHVTGLSISTNWLTPLMSSHLRRHTTKLSNIVVQLRRSNDLVHHALVIIVVNSL